MKHLNDIATAQKNLQAGQSCILSKDRTDNPKLCARVLTDGRLSLYLSYYLGYEKVISPKTGRQTIRMKRRQENLPLFLYENPRTPEQRQHNKEAGEAAKTLLYERRITRRTNDGEYMPNVGKEVNLLKYFQTYVENYGKKDRAVVRQAFHRFTDFLKATPKYEPYAKALRPSQVDRDMVMAFTDYLKSRSRGTGAWTIYARFKKFIKYAFEHDVMGRNPCDGIYIKVSTDTVTKAILSFDEIRALARTPIPGRNDHIRRAFLFCLFTGMRFCDVRELVFADVDYSNRLLTYNQLKTEGHSAHSMVTIPLNDNILSLIGEKGPRMAKIFPLPSYVYCWKVISEWAEDAGIEKHITWHCARHSFAVNVLSNGADIKTVSSLLGHSSITMTEKYLHVIDRYKRAAIDSLPKIDL